MADIGRQLRALTGAHTRIVWTQQQKGWKDWSANTADFKLMGIDSDDRKGERAILSKVGSYASPMLTPGGDRVIYTDNTDRSVYVVGFDGNNRRRLIKGYAIGVMRAPDGVEWFYSRPNNSVSWISKSNPVVLRQIDKPRVKKVVWTKSNVTWNYFQNSPDGKRAAACMPWPKAGMATFPDGTYKEFDRGCWTCMAPDNSYRMWVFDITHRHVKLYDKTGKRLARICVNEAPGIKGWEVYHPRWSNHMQFFTVTGPWSKGLSRPCRESEEKNILMGDGGRNIELYLGRFNKALTKVDGWVRVTKNRFADFHGDTWVHGD